jgi:hypothetical protein
MMDSRLATVYQTGHNSQITPIDPMQDPPIRFFLRQPLAFQGKAMFQ